MGVLARLAAGGSGIRRRFGTEPDLVEQVGQRQRMAEGELHDVSSREDPTITVEVGIEEGRLVEPMPPRRAPRLQVVHAAADPPTPAAEHLVAHRIGQPLDGVVTRDVEPVEVQSGVQLSERELAVATEHRSRRRSQVATPQLAGFRMHRRQRSPPERRRTAALPLRIDRPQPITKSVGVMGRLNEPIDDLARSGDRCIVLDDGCFPIL